jgi:hypothetical protein
MTAGMSGQLPNLPAAKLAIRVMVPEESPGAGGTGALSLGSE